jgi:hypothetical protein
MGIVARVFVIVVAALAITAGFAQAPADPRPTIAAQREAMAALKPMDGVWRGTAWTLLPSGERHDIVQTERIGPFLDGSVKVIEGRGYEPDGRTGFNALGIVSYDPATRSYSMRSYALGRSGDFAFVPTPDGYTWEIPAGPARIRYTAVIKDGTLHEVGDRLVPDRPPLRFFEMTLKRLGDSDWPAAGAVARQ